MAALIAASAHAEPATVERFEGIARTEDGSLAYREQHEVEYEGDRPLQSVTRYFDRSGRKIAELRSDYRSDPYAPRYAFLDEEGRTVESAGMARDGIRLRHGSESRLLALPGAGRVVLGQGLHQLVRAQLESLAEGRPMSVRFGIPSRLDAYAFRIEREGSGDSPVVHLRIGIDNWLLALLAPSLEVEYERATRRLLWYRGVSNLPGPGGERQEVWIVYRYQEPVAGGALAAGGSR